VSGFLLDTNVASEMVKPKPNPGVMHWITNADEWRLFFRVGNVGEIRKGTASHSDPARKTQLGNWLAALIERFSGRILRHRDG